MDRGAWGYSPWGRRRVRYDWVTKQQQQHIFMLHNPVPPHPSNVILSIPQVYSHSPWQPPLQTLCPHVRPSLCQVWALLPVQIMLSAPCPLSSGHAHLSRTVLSFRAVLFRVWSWPTKHNLLSAVLLLQYGWQGPCHMASTDSKLLMAFKDWGGHSWSSVFLPTAGLLGNQDELPIILSTRELHILEWWNI